MQWIQGNPKNWTSLLYFTDPRYLPFPVMKKIWNGQKKKYVQVGNGFSTWKPWTSTSKLIYATKPRESKKVNFIAVFYALPIFAIPTHEKNMKCTKKIYVQVTKGFPTWNPWFSTSKIIYATNPRKSRKLDPIAVFYGPVVLAIRSHEKNMKWPTKRYVQIGNGTILN